MKKEVEKFEEDWGNTLGLNISGKGPANKFLNSWTQKTIH